MKMSNVFGSGESSVDHVAEKGEENDTVDHTNDDDKDDSTMYHVKHIAHTMSTDMESFVSSNHKSHNSSSSSPCTEDQATIASSSSDETTTTTTTNPLFFSCGNPRVEIVTGFIHLYTNHRVPRSSATSPTTPTTPVTTATTIIEDDDVDEDNHKNASLKESQNDQNMLCVVAVPSFISISDFYTFVQSFSSHISHMTILRDEMPNRYMILLTFDNESSMNDFYEQFNGKPFNSFDPEQCQLVYVQSVEYSNNNNNSNSCSTADTSAVGPLIEMPKCPVCLERLDSETSGIITTVCNHEFHCECFTKWGDGTCPICRYNSFDDTNNSRVQCFECNDTTSNLWICLMCGHVGCGRYEQGHARQHYEQTNHIYAMEIESQRVWDYMGDGYVHRIVQNATDGKLVQVMSNNDDEMSQFSESNRNQSTSIRMNSSTAGTMGNFSESISGKACPLTSSGNSNFVGASSSGSSSSTYNDFSSNAGGSSSDDYYRPTSTSYDIDMLEARYNSKIDAILQEYNNLLTKQLVSQRIYFEGKLNELTRSSDDQLNKLSHELDDAKQDCKKLSSQVERLQVDKKKQDKEFEFISELNKTLIAEQKKFKVKYETQQRIYDNKLQDKDKTIQDLQEQLADLMTHFNTQESLSKDMKEASLFVLPGGGTHKRKGKSKTNK